MLEVQTWFLSCSDSYRAINWTGPHTSHLYGKTQSRMCFLRRLWYFTACSNLLQMLVARVLCYTVVCWGGGAHEVSMKLDSLVTVAERRTLDMMDHASQPPRNVISNQRSLLGQTLLLPKLDRPTEQELICPSCPSTPHLER